MCYNESIELKVHYCRQQSLVILSHAQSHRCLVACDFYAIPIYHFGVCR